MLEFGSWEEATSKAGKAPTTTKWIDRAKKNDVRREFVRCRLVARDCGARFQTKSRGSEGILVCGDATAGGKELQECARRDENGVRKT